MCAIKQPYQVIHKKNDNEMLTIIKRMCGKSIESSYIQWSYIDVMQY